MYILTIDGQDQAPTDVQTAMKAMHAAKGVGRTASMRKAGAPAPAPTPSLREVREKRIAERGDQWGEVVHEDDRVRAQKSDDIVARIHTKAGTDKPALWRSMGETLNQWGLENWHAKRQATEDLPYMEDAAADFSRVLAAEGRHYTPVPASDIRLHDDNGTLRLVRRKGAKDLRLPGRVGSSRRRMAEQLGYALPTKAFSFNSEGLERLVRAVHTKGSPNMLPPTAHLKTTSAAVAAMDWNDRAARGMLPNKNVLLHWRNWNNGGVPQLYTATSPTYGLELRADKIMDALAREMPGTKGSYTYDPNTTRLSYEIRFMQDYPPVVGEVYGSLLKGVTGDNGSTAASVLAALIQAICINLTTVEHELLKETIKHKGRNPLDKFIRQVTHTRHVLDEVFPLMVERTEKAATVSAASFFEVRNMRAAVREAVKRDVDLRKLMRDLHPEVKAKALVDIQVEAILVGARDGGQTEAGGESYLAICNGVTALHRHKNCTPILAQQASGIGGRMLAQVLEA